MLEEHPQAMGGAMSRHHDLLLQAVESNRGTVFETVGDAVYASFARASDAVRAAIAGQKAISSEDWGEIGEIRVRMGLHTGDVQVRGEHYFGAVLFRCARLMAIGYGRQVLLSRATCDLVRDSLPPDASIRSLGTHRLKDLAESTEVYQLLHPDLQAEFPALKSLNALANNLPLQATRFIGRERELTTLKDLVSKERLVTIAGTGGAGKTRLALQVAADLVDTFADGVWLVEVGPLADPALVPQAAATVLSVREEPGRTPLESLVEYARRKRLLLLLDSCEHLVQGCAELANALLRSCPDLHILVTSREVLAIGGETVWRVPSLSLPPLPPPPPESLNQYEAVGLFLERASAANNSFRLTHQNASAVLEICQQLDGIPLAIELAAARVRMLSPEQIAARLDDRFRLLTGGNRAAMARQQTLRALVDWSYSLLQDTERILFRRLSVFAGGWTLESAEAVCAFADLDPYDVLDLLSHLVDKSLVIAEEHDGQQRYRMLETIRQYARDCLNEAGELEPVRERHVALFLSLVERARPEEYDTQLLASLGRDYDNLRAALRWAIDSGDSERALRLAGGLWDFWSVRGYYTEGRAWISEILDMADAPTAARARALQTVGHLANCQGDYVAAAELLNESRAVSEEVGDPTLMAASVHLLGNSAAGRGELQEAARLYSEARHLNRGSGNRAAEILNMLQLAEVALQSGDLIEARSVGLEALQASRQRRQQWAIARAEHVLGRVDTAEGDLSSAINAHSHALKIQETLGDQQGRIRSLAALARIARLEGDTVLSRQRYAESVRLARASYELLELARSLEGLAELDATNEPERALRMVGAAGNLRKTIGAAPYPEEQRRIDSWLQPLYPRLGEKACAEARAVGRGMSLDQTIAEALATTEVAAC